MSYSKRSKQFYGQPEWDKRFEECSKMCHVALVSKISHHHKWNWMNEMHNGLITQSGASMRLNPQFIACVAKRCKT